jgi:hypothetical protein
MNSLVWGHGWNARKIDRWWVAPDVVSEQDSACLWEPVPIRGRDHAIWLLSDSQDVVLDMRAMLADASSNSWRLSGHHVRELIAQQLADRQVLLFTKVVAAAPLGGWVSSAAIPQGLSSRPPIAAARTATKSTPSPAPRPVHALEDEPALAFEPEFASANQDIQAEMLRKAAVAGVPFCAVCEELRRQGAAVRLLREAA